MVVILLTTSTLPSVSISPTESVEAVLIEGNLTRRQRAGEGAEQLAGGRCNEVVEGGGVGLLIVGRDAIVLGHLAVNTEQH
jgi:hypothetical protein